MNTSKSNFNNHKINNIIAYIHYVGIHSSTSGLVNYVYYLLILYNVIIACARVYL